MAQYTILTRSSIDEITKEFDLGNIDHWAHLEGGAENSNYSITTKGKRYIITVCEKKSYSSARNLANLLLHLESFNFQTNKLITRSNGDPVITINNKQILVKEYVEGHVVLDMNTRLLTKLGSVIAQLHSIPVPEYLPTDFSYGLQAFDETNDWGLSHQFIEWLAKIQDYIKDHLNNDLPRCLIHGDIFADNVVVTDRDVPVILDFEEATYYYRIFDIGMAIVGLCRKNETVDQNKAKALLKGYLQVNGLSKLELENINPFIIYAAAATAFWRFRQYHVLHPDSNMMDHHLEMQRIADDVYYNPINLL